MKRVYNTGYQRNIYHVKLDNNKVRVTYNSKVIFDSDDVRRVFIGKSLKNKANSSVAYGTEHDGNSILLQMMTDEYIYINDRICSFRLLENDKDREIEWNDYFMMLAIINHDFKGLYQLYRYKKIIKYVSEIDNLGCSYPYAIDNYNNVYLLKMCGFVLKKLASPYKCNPYAYFNNINKLSYYKQQIGAILDFNYRSTSANYRWGWQKRMHDKYFYILDHDTGKSEHLTEEKYIAIFKEFNKLDNLEYLQNVSIHHVNEENLLHYSYYNFEKLIKYNKNEEII
jgi:hypothetical protein